MRKRVISLFILLTMTTALVACGENKENVGNKKDCISIYVGGTIFDSSLDPVKGAMSYGFSFTNNSLMKINPKSEYVGDLATNWIISQDSLEYTFKLRDDVKFQDGSEFSAEDVVFTYNMVKENQGENENVDLSKLKKVEEVDKYTVKFILSEPYSPFFDTVAQLGIVPSDNYDSKKFDKEPVGTGPWKVKQYETGQQIIVEANENYFDGAPKIRQVTFVKMDNEAAFSNAKSGQLDIVMVAPNYANEKIEGMQIENLETMDVRNISLPCLKEQVVKNEKGIDIKVGNNITSDLAVRKALSIGIDRDSIIKNALSGIGKPASGFTSNLSWGYTNKYRNNEIDEAKKILKEAGWEDKDGDKILEKNGINCEFTIYTPSTDGERYLLGVAVAEDAKKLGIKINIKQGTWDELFAACSTDGVLWGWGQYSPTVLQSLFYSGMFLHGTNGNKAGYSNEYVDKLINEAINTNSQKVAIDKWKEVQKVTADDYPYLYIVNIEHSYFINDSLDISLDTQIPHPHGHGIPIICNMKDWEIK